MKAEDHFSNVVPISHRQALILALGRTRFPGSFSEDEALELIRWAIGVVVSYETLQKVAQGKLLVDIHIGKEPIFILPDRLNEYQRHVQIP